MSAAYEAIWHAIIVGPVLIFIAVFELFATLAGVFFQEPDRFGDQPLTFDDDHGIDEVGMA